MLGVYGTRFAWILYASNFALVGGSLTLVWAYAVARDFTVDSIDRRTGWLISIRGLLSPLVFLLSIAVAAVSLEAAFLTPILIAPLQALWVRYYRSWVDSGDR